MTRNKDDKPTISKESQLSRLAKLDDDIELEKGVEEYYRDRQLWARHRVEQRRKELDRDDRDRDAEARETNKSQSRAAALADSFLEEMGVKVGAEGPAMPQPLRLMMKRENVKTAPASPAKRSVEEAEGLLEEEEEEDYQVTRKKRQLIRLEDDVDVSRPRENGSTQDRLQDLVSSIPSDTKGLWEYPIPWEQLDHVQPCY